MQVAAAAQRLKQQRGGSLKVVRTGGACLSRRLSATGIAHQLIQADCNRLAQVHRNVFFARGDAQQPMAMAQVFVGQTALLRTEHQSDVARWQTAADELRTFFEPVERVLQFAVIARGGSHHQRAVGHGFSHAAVLFRTLENHRGTDGGTRLAKRRFVRIHHPQLEKPKVAHGPGSRTNVEQIARGHEHNAQTAGFSGSVQACILRHAGSPVRAAVARAGAETSAPAARAKQSLYFLVATIKSLGPGRRTRVTSRNPAARSQSAYSGSL